MSGRHGGRSSEYAGTRDYVEEKPVDVLIRHIGRWGARENGRSLAADQKGDCEWMTIRYGVWQGLLVGKIYTFNGRKGKVLEKRENAGLHSKSGLPRILVEWRS